MMFIEKGNSFQITGSRYFRISIFKQGRVQERKNPREEQEIDFKISKTSKARIQLPNLIYQFLLNSIQPQPS